MSVTVQNVYSQGCLVLLEDSGLTTGVYTEAQFLRDFHAVMLDFCQRTRLVHGVFTAMVTAEVAEYLVPDDIMEVSTCFYNARLIQKTSRQELDHLIHNWRKRWDIPRFWHEDDLDIKTVQIVPGPTISGDTIAGDVPPIGEYDTFAVGDCNLTFVGPRAPDEEAWELADMLSFIPDIFTHYLVYGMLAKIFSADGETRDVQRAAYCTTRYEEGAALAAGLLEELESEEANS